MAGTFTHWMVAEEALGKYDRLSQKHHYFPTILFRKHFVCVGASGPDYPYLTDILLGKHSWADRMHYENTGDFICNGIRNLHGLNGEAFNTCLAWLCGFATHLVTDSVIHPVVQAIVGPYIFNQTDHRHCELTQDTFIFHEIKGLEIEYATYADLFRMCSDPPNASDKINANLKEFWFKTLKDTHPGATDKQVSNIDPDSWHKNFLSRISSAEDPIAIFRPIAEDEKLAYKKTAEITSGEWQRFVKQVNLPGKKTGEFKKNAFDYTVNKVIETWDRLFVDIENDNPDGPALYIKNWNLDTGVNEDNPYFWT